MPFEITDFETLMKLDEESGDVFVGRSPRYPWGRVYGGQVVAQALRAATSTVPPDRFVHSLHAHFLRGGEADEPIRFAVERVRDGGSFATRNVVASQNAGSILQLSASFQVDESASQVDVQAFDLPRDLPQPESLPSVAWGPLLDRRLVAMKDARAAYWLRVEGMRSVDPAAQACALAYASDDVPTEAANQSHPLRGSIESTDTAYFTTFVGASLDHAIWFHRRGRHDDFVLHDFQGHGVAGARGLGVGKIFSRDGIHLATVAQEILIRQRR